MLSHLQLDSQGLPQLVGRIHRFDHWRINLRQKGRVVKGAIRGEVNTN